MELCRNKSSYEVNLESGIGVAVYLEYGDCFTLLFVIEASGCVKATPVPTEFSLGCTAVPILYWFSLHL